MSGVLPNVFYVIEKNVKISEIPFQAPNQKHIQKTHWLWDEGTGSATMLINFLVLGLILAALYSYCISAWEIQSFSHKLTGKHKN